MRELKDESKFSRQTNIVTIQCSGTRRIEQISQYPGDGDELINAPVSLILRYINMILIFRSGEKEQSELLVGQASH
jgi:hypothetical protein